MSERKDSLTRKSNETECIAQLNIDGSGKCEIKTPIGLLSHMLELFAFHGCFDLDLTVKGDTHIDIHHTNEDIGITLGKLFRKALGNMEGIKRFGSGFAPMEKTLGHTVVDISGRGYSTISIGNPGVITGPIREQDGYNISYLEHFMESFAKGLGATINVSITGVSEDLHTNLETVFKSLGLALDQATQVDPRRKGQVPSTKGIID